LKRGDDPLEQEVGLNPDRDRRRAALRQLYDLRKSDPPLISGTEKQYPMQSRGSRNLIENLKKSLTMEESQYHNTSSHEILPFIFLSIRQKNKYST